MGALALKVTNLAGRRYLLVYVLLLRGQSAGECCSYRLRLGPRKSGQHHLSFNGAYAHNELGYS
jgi:hypothetical protein